VVRVILDLPPTTMLAGVALNTDLLVVFILVFFALLYSVTSGLWGVVLTDLVEFVVAVIGTVVLAFVAMGKIGGTSGLREQLAATHQESSLAFVPSFSDSKLPLVAIVTFLFVQWWATPYVDGSGQKAQRFLACKDERNALLSGVWNLAVQWVIRSWPVYLAALVSLVLYPAATDHESVYVRMVSDLLPIGLRGLMVAGFFSAFMSTFEGILNLCAAYLSNDVYRRFVARQKDEKHQVRASRGISIGVAVTAGIVSLFLPSILTAYRFKMELMAGLGLVSALRWFWWRINAKTELATLAVSVGLAIGLNFVPGVSGDGAGPSALRLLIVVAGCALTTFVTALVTRPETDERLIEFYEKVRPPALLWGPIAAKASPGKGFITGRTMVEVGVCIVFVFAGMFGIGKLLLGEPMLGAGLTGLGLIALGYLYANVLRKPAEPKAEPPASVAVG
jgi:Na+/proline symporter